MPKQIDEKELRAEIEAYTKRYIDKSIVRSDDYNDFRKDFVPTSFTLYENLCNLSEKIIKIKPDSKKEPVLKEALETCHINATTAGVTSFAILFPIVFVLVGTLLVSLITIGLMNGESFMFFLFVVMFFAALMIGPLSKFPLIMAQNWRLRASNQMVLSIFYVVSYMRHTSNLELAIKFTSDHISPPLSLDFKKILWDVETGSYDTVKESLDAYLAKWKEYAPEFVDSMRLVSSSLYETNEQKRVEALEKSMALILEATYEKMLHFAQNLQSPMTMLHMLGVILPILGLVILPLVVSFMDSVKWYHISVLYNIFLPLMVLYLGRVILSTRPMGYGQADITEVNPELKKHQRYTMKFFGRQKDIEPKWAALALGFFVVLIGLSPLIIYQFTHGEKTVWDITLHEGKLSIVSNPYMVQAAQYSFLGYIFDKAGINIVGPYGLGATLLSILIPFGMALALSWYYRQKTKKIIKIRDMTKKLEDEFAAALFQLGNRMGDGMPAEIAFAKVAANMEDSASAGFYDLVANNIVTLGFGVEEAIFDKKHGALSKYPSALIESSMKVFVESARKGADVASKALINISTYIKEMHRVEERLKDLMAEITSSMQSQINFLAPLISGIVIGLTSMITLIMNNLSYQIRVLGQGSATGPATPVGGLPDMIGDTIPTFYFQIVVGVYVVQITILLTQMLNTIQNGYDPLSEKQMLGSYILKSGILYSIVSMLVIIIFNLVAATVMANIDLGLGG